MNDPVHGMHPESADLQRVADGESVDPRIAAHIDTCAPCRDEIAAVRRVTAALSLGSKAPDSMGARIQARRSGSARGLPKPRAHPRYRIRSFVLPVGLAAAALLIVFVPRAVRRPQSEVGSAGIGAKGALPADQILSETVVTEEGPSSIDSISWSIAAPGIVVELRYLEGRSESPQALRLADRIAELLRAEGVNPSDITVRAEPAGAFPASFPASGVAVKMRRPAFSRP